ncbi:hypothetical protein DRZ78_00895 [Candidatus Aerophobetes bacterium]|uniref:RNA polymerase sigma factor 54 DNA-binding domain-containing protein n=1 Tax=Aerophobetes bacterium TaxID=2030807 RepID=A0A662D1N2_UNCAE|nr:MAG: hypothetical protein DRZ78_00895 [Candidatus Aerophobetes bacterium]
MSPKYGMEARQGISQRLKLVGKMKLGQFLSLPEDRFKIYLKKIEADPLFRELRDKYRLISYKKFRDVSRRPSSLELKEEFIPQNDGFDVEDLLEKNPEALAVLKKVGDIIGPRDFSNFLSGGRLEIREIEERCHLSPKERQIFKNFINKFQLQSIFDSSSSLLPVSSPRFFKIASIEKRGNELIICPLDKESYLIKGRYLINYNRFEQLIAEKKFTRVQINRISAFFKKLNLINRRTTTLYQVIYHLKEIQRRFFESENPQDLVPLTQSELARRIGVYPSSISRAIADKSILTPLGEEKPLKFFFSKKRVQNLLLEILAEEKREMKAGILSGPLSDEEIRKRLKRRYGVNMSRRTVCKYRKALRIPPSRQRG